MADGFWPGQKITITITGEIKSILEPGVLEINTGAEIPYVIDPREPGVQIKVDGKVDGPKPGDVVLGSNGYVAALGEMGYLCLRGTDRGRFIYYNAVQTDIGYFNPPDYKRIDLDRAAYPPF